jgi:spore germination cell wall hydrolase CwlJ-like protein
MRKLLEWLDVSHAFWAAAHATAGVVCLTGVSGALLGSIIKPEVAPPHHAARSVAAHAAPIETALRTSIDEQPSLAVPAVFRSADTTSALLHNAVAVSSSPVIHISLGNLEKERRCLTETIYFEARGESSVGQLAIAEVILNRAMSGRFPASICGVVFQGAKSNQCQFSFACSSDLTKPRDPVAWRKAQRLAHYVLAGKVRNTIVGSAIYFHATYVTPHWAQDMVEVAKIGQHIFYRSADDGDQS